MGSHAHNALCGRRIDRNIQSVLPDLVPNTALCVSLPDLVFEVTTVTLAQPLLAAQQHQPVQSTANSTARSYQATCMSLPGTCVYQSACRYCCSCATCSSRADCPAISSFQLDATHSPFSTSLAHGAHALRLVLLPENAHQMHCSPCLTFGFKLIEWPTVQCQQLSHSLVTRSDRCWWTRSAAPCCCSPSPSLDDGLLPYVRGMWSKRALWYQPPHSRHRMCRLPTQRGHCTQRLW